MDAGGRMYTNWNDYLRNNNFPQGVMIYPANGTYTPEQVDRQDDKVALIAQETQSCKPSARAKDLLDKIAFGTGLALTAAAVVTAVPLGFFAYSTVASISTGSYYVGLVCTAYSVTT